jgi:Glycosyl transferase family 2
MNGRNNLKTASEASVILIAPEGPIGIARILERLRAQTAAARLEIVIAAPADDVAELAALSEPAFADVRVIAADLSTSARARAAAIHEARSPIVIFVEDHCFPIRDDWAARILAAHQQPHVGVGPIMRNANPVTTTSWASLAVEYGPFMDRPESGPVDFIPGHNSSYKREALLQLGDALSDMLEAEWVMHLALRARGYTFWLDTSIEVEHLNFSRLAPALKLQLLNGWMYAASRSASWSVQKRLLYAILFPGIALRRMIMVSGQMFGAPSTRKHALRSLPMVVVLLLVSGFGEGIGYAFGDCGQRNALALMEYRRWRNLLPKEVGLVR